MEPTSPQGGSRTWRTADAIHIDVRGLQPPEPMIAILRLIDSGTVGDVLVAHLDREPIFLYPELDERGWNHAVADFSPSEGEVILRLTRQEQR